MPKSVIHLDGAFISDERTLHFIVHGFGGARRRRDGQLDGPKLFNQHFIVIINIVRVILIRCASVEHHPNHLWVRQWVFVRTLDEITSAFWRLRETGGPEELKKVGHRRLAPVLMPLI